MKFSIVIPVYNVECYLEECLCSIINQTYRNLEIIIVNDGSTDNSWDIIKKYAREDSRIIVINQENQGLSIARNVGIEKSTGDYLMFIDSDDYISLEVCQSAVDFMKRYGKMDMLQFARYRFDTVKKKKEEVCLDGTLIYAGVDLLEKSVKAGRFFASSCNKIYRRGFLEQYGMKFIKDIYYEDLYFVFQCMIYCRVIGLLSDTYYFYRITPGSITNTIKEKDRDVLKTVEMLELFLEGVNPLLKKTFWFRKLVYSWVSNAVCFKYPQQYPFSRKANRIVKSILYDSVFFKYVDFFAYTKGIPLKYKYSSWLSLNIYPLYVLFIYCFFNVRRLLK